MAEYSLKFLFFLHIFIIMHVREEWRKSLIGYALVWKRNNENNHCKFDFRGVVGS